MNLTLPPSVLGFALSWWKALVGAIVVAGPIFLLGQCSGAGHARDKTDAAQAVAVASALKTDGAAKEVAGTERLADERQVNALTEKLTDAVAQVPDETPDAVAVRLGCQRLRNAGQDVSKLAACR